MINVAELEHDAEVSRFASGGHGAVDEYNGCAHPVKEARKVNVHTVAGVRIQKDVLAVPIAQAEDVSDHGPNCGRARERQPGIVPASWLREARQEPAVHARRKQCQHLV